MPPNPDVPVYPTARRFSQYYVPLAVYLGLDVEVKTETKTAIYAISVHDGSYTTDYYTGEIALDHKNKTDKELKLEGLEKLKDVVKRYAEAQHYKVQIVAFSTSVNSPWNTPNDDPVHTASSTFWRDLDAIPFRVETHGDLPDERACASVRKAVMWVSPQYPGNIPRVSVGFRHEVEVDFNGIIHMVDLIDYKDGVCADTWRIVCQMAKTFKERNLRVSFFNSTPQGGGVALMRHALLRFYHLLGLDVHWYVARPKPEVFDITKRKFHNVLQGVAPKDTFLTEHDKQMFIEWSDDNYLRFWSSAKGPIHNSDIVVIDDPQLVGIIPHIKRQFPETRVIFRSHIEMRADLIREDPHGPQAVTWEFLWGFIQQADLFIAHPMDNFIPDVVPRRNVVLMPATTDPLDGLNKFLNPWSRQYYQLVFNRVCIDQGANEVDFSRPYMVQVARFDPSKGIPDVLESYRLLRARMDKENHPESLIPQLVICGHGSVDDPDGTVIYEQTHKTICSEKYASIFSDIIVARLPPCDQLLNFILSDAQVALQLSHREGFEVKVTEALNKGIPVIAYEAGGIPLQIKRDVTGFLVPIGDTQKVADHMYDLMTNMKLRMQMGKAAKESITEEFFTVWNSLCWLHLFIELTNKQGDYDCTGLLNEEDTYARNSGVGDCQKVSDLWKRKYNYNP